MNIKLQDLTFDVIQQLFADVLSQKYGQLNFPNASDSTTTVRNERDLEYWKTGIMNGYGNIELELNPEASNSREQIKVLDPKFLANKNSYIDAKSSYLDSERAAGRTSGLDEEMSGGDYIKFLMDKYYEYRTLAMDPTINDQATKLYLDKASEYYARAQDAMDEIEPDNTDHLSDEDKALPNVSLADQEAELSDRDKAMIDKYEDEEANREISKIDADMYRESKNNNKMNEIDLKRWTKLAGINEGMDATSLMGKYITLSQNVGMSGYQPKTAQDVIDIMPKFQTPGFGIKVHDTDPGRASFGNAVYLVQQDGSLKMVSNNYDTSG